MFQETFKNGCSRFVSNSRKLKTTHNSRVNNFIMALQAFNGKLYKHKNELTKIICMSMSES